MKRSLFFLSQLSLYLAVIIVLFGAVLEFYNITWGTGVWLGRFSFKWALAFLVFTLFCVFCQVLIILVLQRHETTMRVFDRLASLRDRLGVVRWILAVMLLLMPAWLLQYTAWGLILHGPYLRILIWAVSTVLIGIFITRAQGRLLTWHGMLASLALMSGMIMFVSSLRDVTDYPFSLGWSEGNRLWDYSVMFGREIYIYPEKQPIPVFLDVGRQFVGGIPFLIPGVTIVQARLWVALVNVVPYLILGWIAFSLPRKHFLYVFLAGIWAYLFVKQGPIHPPLLLCAIVVAFAWRKPLWIAVPLILGAGYFAATSRYTWMFAPAMWAGMLELSGATLENNRLTRNSWVRAIAVGLAGLSGGYLIPSYGPILMARISSVLRSQSGDPVSGAGGGMTPAAIADVISEQTLLWYRLFPNATYEQGILLGLFLAIFPLVVLLVYLYKIRRWNLNGWQKPAILLPLLAFLVVGLIVSTKIGGGGDLHNMDMFLIGLLFAGAMAWRNGGYEWIKQTDQSPLWIRVMLLLLLVIPACQPLRYMTPLSVSEDLQWVKTLADIPPEAPVPDILPSESDTLETLESIRRAVADASTRGEVLFADQRQLLTFGFIEGIPLVPEYDKKLLINQAMSDDARYFSRFYKDLAEQRFSLIITNPLYEVIRTEADMFGEENNAWVKWVTIPLLCYYEPVLTFREAEIQLLAPRRDISNCEKSLPTYEDAQASPSP
jgi:hypothetical protein